MYIWDYSSYAVSLYHQISTVRCHQCKPQNFTREVPIFSQFPFDIKFQTLIYNAPTPMKTPELRHSRCLPKTVSFLLDSAGIQKIHSTHHFSLQAPMWYCFSVHTSRIPNLLISKGHLVS